MKTSFVAIGFLLLTACSSTPSNDTIFIISQDELNQLKLSYYSDYFSFVGWDENGAVAFALDNNRGQDGNSWQAEHFVVLFDEQSGWQAPQGNGAYDNLDRKLSAIPDSDYFTFKGTPAIGFEIDSQLNKLNLKTAPIKTIIDNKQGLSKYRLGSAEATLLWNNREIKGRVIHEHLFLPAFNRLTRSYMGVFDDFHGIYAAVDKTGDFYFHSQKSDFLAPLTGYDEGFLVLNGDAIPLTEFSINTDERKQALGFYRWPMRWTGAFHGSNADYQFELNLHQKNNIANWVIGGFSMGIVNGELNTKNRVMKIFGLGELII